MNSVTLGDVMHLTGGFGLGIDYAVRLSLRYFTTSNKQLLLIVYSLSSKAEQMHH